MSETTSPVVTGEDAGPETVGEERGTVDEPTATSPRVESAAEPTDSPAQAEPPAAPPASPTPSPDSTDDNIITRAEATVRCLQSGISTLDVAALAACVDELLG